MEVENYVEQRHDEIESDQINTYLIDLTFYQKIFFFVIWLPLIHYAFKQNFKEDRYFLKVEQAEYYALGGWTSFLTSGVLSAFLFPKSDYWGFFIILLILFTGFFIYDITIARSKRLERLRIFYSEKK